MNLNGLDPTDVSILNLIQKDARLTHKEIAWKTNKSLSAIQVRVRKLLNLGIIKRFVTLLDRSLVNKGLAVFTMIKLSNYSQQALLEFQESAGALEEVMECYHVSGDRDFILKVVIKDMVEYNAFILEKLSVVPHIGSVQSLFVICESKYETAFNL
ncbi:Lrp/AsnC family transcriptional regulator [Pedobacter sp. GR22-6]|uniref:Lrp/AsnC family transcriptional regulator n=1 Tax=Pedobacter sp. GR22-6 TaxID=3127957 RepID=UPI00307E0199